MAINDKITSAKVAVRSMKNRLLSKLKFPPFIQHKSGVSTIRIARHHREGEMSVAMDFDAFPQR